MITTTNEDAVSETARRGDPDRELLYPFRGTRPRFTRGESRLSTDQVRRQVRGFLSAGAVQRSGIRDLLAQEIAGAPDPAALGLAVLQECVHSAKAGRLDDAVEVLRSAGVPAASMAAALCDDTRSFFSLPEDYQYALIRLAGVSEDSWSAVLLDEAIHRKDGPACEAAVTVYGNRTGEHARTVLRWVAEHSPSPLIRDLALEYVHESEA